MPRKQTGGHKSTAGTGSRAQGTHDSGSGGGQALGDGSHRHPTGVRGGMGGGAGGRKAGQDRDRNQDTGRAGEFDERELPASDRETGDEFGGVLSLSTAEADNRNAEFGRSDMMHIEEIGESQEPAAATAADFSLIGATMEGAGISETKGLHEQELWGSTQPPQRAGTLAGSEKGGGGRSSQKRGGGGKPGGASNRGSTGVRGSGTRATGGGKNPGPGQAGGSEDNLTRGSSKSGGKLERSGSEVKGGPEGGSGGRGSSGKGAAGKQAGDKGASRATNRAKPPKR